MPSPGGSRAFDDLNYSSPIAQRASGGEPGNAGTDDQNSNIGTQQGTSSGWLGGRMGWRARWCAWLAGAVAVVGLVVEDAAASVEFDLAATGQQRLELGAASLYPRLQPRRCQTDVGGRIGLRKTVQIGELERLAVDRGQLRQQWLHASGQLGSRFGRAWFGSRRCGSFQFQLGAGGPLAADHGPSVVIGDGVAGDCVDPGANCPPIGELVGVAVDAQHDVLQDVFGAVPV
jgi:hypothetical protein